MTNAGAPCFQFSATGKCSFETACRFAHGDAAPGRSYPSAAAPAPAAPSSVPAEALRERRTGGVKSVLFLTGLPPCVAARLVKKALSAAVRAFHGVPRLGCTHEGHTRGWAHVTLPSADAGEAARLALDGAALDVQLVGRSVSCTLTAAYVTDKRDTLFPTLTREQRLALRLDPTALFSVTDGVTADRTTSCLQLLLSLGGHGQWSVDDACACAGGNALSFARCEAVSAVRCTELDPSRAGALSHNAGVVGLAHRIAVRCGDYTEEKEEDSCADVLFCDPPWGGTDYSARDVIPVEGLGLSGIPLSELAARARRRGAACVAFGTPRNYDDSGLARALSAQREGEAREADRPLPFRLEFGNRMLVLALHLGEGRRFAFPTAALDAIVAALVAWNGVHGDEHHPRFWDWEKEGWVPLSRWKGARPVKAV